jgi:hypothetical protein
MGVRLKNREAFPATKVRSVVPWDWHGVKKLGVEVGFALNSLKK